MQESFLHFIWQYQYFDKTDLKTIDDLSIQIIEQGLLNSNAGPDFNNSKVIIDNMEWRGSIEIHIKSSDWNIHQHQKDKAYNNVVLHVVWENDEDVLRQDGTLIPAMELKSRVDSTLLDRFQKFVNNPVVQIPCEHHFEKVSDILKISTLDKMGMERLDEKSSQIKDLLEANNGDWDETTYQLLAKNLGLKINSEPFHELSKSVPFKLLKKHNGSLLQLEALLFGMAGFLDDAISDEYHAILAKEYQFLKQKYQLDQKLNKFRWKLMRLRPANFPALRIAQLAAILHNKQFIFSVFTSDISPREISQWLKQKPSIYWDTHYNFESESDGKNPEIGQTTIDNIVINTIAPLLIAYGKQIDQQDYIDRAVDLLGTIKPEKNRITDIWDSISFKAKSAFDSQAQIQLFNNYCLKKQCLSCNIGTSILKPQ
jgi:hypothetical protein